MKIAILTRESFSTYIYNLVAGLYELGFCDITIVSIPQDLKMVFKNNLNKFKVSSFTLYLAKFIRLAKAYYKFKKVGINHVIKQARGKNYNENDLIKLLLQNRFNIAIAYNSGLLREEILSIPKFGVICAHPALLPFGRGFSGHLQSVLLGIPMGVTVFRIDKGVDTGDIYLQEELDISRCKSKDDLNNEFSKKELELTLKTILGISRNTLFPKKQAKKYKYWKLSEEEINKADKVLNQIFLKNKQ